MKINQQIIEEIFDSIDKENLFWKDYIETPEGKVSYELRFISCWDLERLHEIIIGDVDRKFYATFYVSVFISKEDEDYRQKLKLKFLEKVYQFNDICY
jgi:hypothetical protein